MGERPRREIDQGVGGKSGAGRSGSKEAAFERLENKGNRALWGGEKKRWNKVFPKKGRKKGLKRDTLKTSKDQVFQQPQIKSRKGRKPHMQAKKNCLSLDFEEEKRGVLRKGKKVNGGVGKSLPPVWQGEGKKKSQLIKLAQSLRKKWVQATKKMSKKRRRVGKPGNPARSKEKDLGKSSVVREVQKRKVVGGM